MKRILTAALLGIVLATTLVGVPQTSLAASSHQTQSSLASTVTAFGYAAMHGPGNKADTFATAALLARAPARHVSNLMGPAQNPPQAFTFQILSYAGNSASVTITWKWGAQGNMDSTTWVYTANGWKLSAMQFVRPLATRDSLLITNYLFMQAMKAGGAGLNKYATSALVRRAPQGQVYSFYGFQNPARDSQARIDRYSNSYASVTQSFRFGRQLVEQRHTIWVYTAQGWKVDAIVGPGRG